MIEQVDRRVADLRLLVSEFEERLIDEDRDTSLLSRDLAELTYTVLRLEQTLQAVGGQQPPRKEATAPEP